MATSSKNSDGVYPENTENITFRKLSDSLKIACDKLKSVHEPIRSDQSLSTEDFWTIFTEASRKVSQETTKVCMMYSKPPIPSKKDSVPLVNSVEEACLAVLAVFHKLPLKRGRTLHKAICDVVLSILQAVQTLCLEIDSAGPSQLTSTANVWEKCDMVKEIPRDNKEAALSVLKWNYGLVEDALIELEESIENPPENFHEDLVDALESRNGVNLHQKENCTLSDSDRLLLPPSGGLVKAAKAVLKKSSAALGRNEFQNESDQNHVDHLVELSERTSALVDDLVLATYPPLSLSQLGTQASNLSIHLKSILEVVQSSNFVTEADQTWIDFLSHAVDHNLQKINELL